MQLQGAGRGTPPPLRLPCGAEGEAGSAFFIPSLCRILAATLDKEGRQGGATKGERHVARRVLAALQAAMVLVEIASSQRGAAFSATLRRPLALGFVLAALQAALSPPKGSQNFNPPAHGNRTLMRMCSISSAPNRLVTLIEVAAGMMLVDPPTGSQNSPSRRFADSMS